MGSLPFLHCDIVDVPDGLPDDLDLGGARLDRRVPAVERLLTPHTHNFVDKLNTGLILNAFHATKPRENDRSNPSTLHFNSTPLPCQLIL